MSDITVLKDYPAKQVIGGDFDVQLTNDKGYCRTAPISITIKSFPGDKHEWLRDFTIGFDDKDGYWAYSHGSMITAEKQAKQITAGFELGDTIKIEGKAFTIEPDNNHNIKLVTQ